MQKLETGQVLKYPVELYLSRKTIALVIALGLSLFPLYFYGLPLAQEDNEWFVIVFTWLMMVMIVMAVLSILIALIKGEPVLRITDEGIDILQVLRRPQQKKLLWQDISYIDIDHHVIKHSEIWMLVIQPKQGKVIQYPIRPMRYQNYILNEMEIVNTLQLAFEGNAAIRYEPIEIDRIKLVTKKTKYLLLILIVLLFAVYLFAVFK